MVPTDTGTDTLAHELAEWALALEPSEDELALARRSLSDTLAVALAARGNPIVDALECQPDGMRWGAVSHVLDFDDLHVESTTHISTVIVPAVLAVGGGPADYLAGAGVMARLGAALGWQHYAAGWHATCTAGAPAAAAAVGRALGLDRDQLAAAISLAVPAAGGVQSSFGTQAKSLQIGFAVEAGIRAAQLVGKGATAAPASLTQWLDLVQGQRDSVVIDGPAVPGGLAVKLFPCCYAMQRPIAAVRAVSDMLPDDPSRITSIRVSTPQSGMTPLIHDRPATGLEAKFSMPYAIATAILDEYPGFAAFDDDAVARTAARRLVDLVQVDVSDSGASLLDGSVVVEIYADARSVRTELAVPPGAPTASVTPVQLADKLAACGEDVPGLLAGVGYDNAAALLRECFPRRERERAGRVQPTTDRGTQSMQVREGGMAR